MNTPIAWTIAGSDSSGGAGMHADVRTFQYLNIHNCTILTAVTAQNPHDVSAIYPLPGEVIQAQMNALNQAYIPQAIKIGMLGSTNAIELLENYLKSYRGKVVLDPVMISTSGKHLFNTDKKSYVRKLATLFPYIDLLTPNVPEAEAFINRKIDSYDEIINAANEILSMGVKSVVIKAGHFEDDKRSLDYWTNGEESFWLSCPRYERKNYRGSGCVFSSAVTASLASGYEIKDALVIAKMYINRGIRLANHQDNDIAMIHHSSWPDDIHDLPYLMDMPLHDAPLAFTSLVPDGIGLYPIVDSADWLKKLLPLGVKFIQLRVKNKSGLALENEIKYAIQLAKQYDAHLFINDHWELAISLRAYGVHLGQEDIKDADIKKIYAAGLRLGVSTHCFHEVARAHAYRPSYIACGPIFATTSKIMPFMPQGLENLKYWRRLLRNDSIVAIGGINADNLMDVAGTKVDGIAMISAITQADNPEQTTLKLLKMMDEL